MQFEHILADSVCNNLVHRATRRIELFGTGRTMPFNSWREDPDEPFRIAPDRRKANRRKARKRRKAQKG